ncbi:PAS domain S-box protein [Verrucomicrobia bacterium S94]|nr:PAS domain S-box protein [Verrucomicrobia bacterium S94]
MGKGSSIHPSPKSRGDRFLMAWFISLYYLLFGVVWISCSDMIAATVATSEEQLKTFSLIKGWLFIGITAVLLWILLKKETGKISVQQKQIEETAVHLKTAQSIAHLGSWELSGEENRLIWSESVYDLFGLPFEEEPTVESSMEVVHPDDRDSVIQSFQASLKSCSPHDVVHRIIRPDTGETRYMHEYCEHVLRPDGTILKTIGTVRDVTDQEVQKQLLEERELKYRSLVEDTPVMLCNFSPDGTILFVNRAYGAYFGTDAQALIGSSFIDILPEEHREQLRDRIQSLTPADPLLVNEHPVQCPSGEVAWHRWTHRALFDDSGILQSCQSFGEDITGQRNNLMELNLNRKLLNDVVSAVPGLMWLKDENGIYLFCNPRFEELYGQEKEQIVGRTDYDFVDKETADLFRHYDQKVVETGSVSVNEELLTFASDGHQELLETIKTPMYDDDGRLIGILGMSRDITDRKRVEEQIANHQKELEEEVLERTKELRTIVNAMAGRENRMAELKAINKTLCSQLEAAGIVPDVTDPLQQFRADNPDEGQI